MAVRQWPGFCAEWTNQMEGAAHQPWHGKNAKCPVQFYAQAIVFALPPVFDSGGAFGKSLRKVQIEIPVMEVAAFVQFSGKEKIGV